MSAAQPGTPVCPNDGMILNRHGVMLNLPPGDDDTAVSPELGEIITDVYTCPACGHTDGVRVDGDPSTPSS